MRRLFLLAIDGNLPFLRFFRGKPGQPFFRAAFLGLFLALIFIPAQVEACNCDTTKTIEAHIADANVIVLGTCNNVNTNPIKGGVNVSFQVDSSWNRAIEPNATFHSNFANQCGAEFEVGKQYIVFGKKRHQTVETSKCEPNQLMDEEGEALLAILGQGFPPGRPEMAMKMNLLILGLGVGGLLLVGFVVLRKKIFRKKGAAAS